jgi:glycerol-3-phosphate dehydrogenase
MRGKEILGLALRINDLVSLDRNRLADPGKHIPRGRTISKAACLELVPDIPQQGLTGAAIYYDAQVYNSERLPLAFIRSAVDAGAKVSNYTEVTGLLRDDDRIFGVRARDLESGDTLEVRAKMVVNAAGPWLSRVLASLDNRGKLDGVRFAKAINLVMPAIFDEYAVGLTSTQRHHDNDAVVNKGGRFLFCAPWRGRSLIGTDYIPFYGDPDDAQATETEVRGFLSEIREAHPAVEWTLDDIHSVHSGLVPIQGVDKRTGSVQLTKHYEIQGFDTFGLKGLISLLGVKYTTARYVAEKVVDVVVRTSDKPSAPCRTAGTPLHGGQIEQFDSFLESATETRPEGLEVETLRGLVYNYGSEYPEVLKYGHARERANGDSPDDRWGLQAQVRHAVREEMAQHLTDVVFRRTEVGSAGYPGDATLQFCAEVMAEEMGWRPDKLQEELEAVKEAFWGLGRPANNG